MAINSNLIRRPSDRGLFLAAAIGFPLLVLIGYFKTYYFGAFFDAKPLANSLVRAHGAIMTLWVVYFTAQVALIRSKNVKLHMTMGMAGVALAALLVVVGLATAYDAHIVRATSPIGINPHSFLLVPLVDMFLFVVFFGGAIYYRKKSTEHKTLMLMTAINFVAPALGRIQIVPENLTILWVFGMPCMIAIACLIWHSIKHRRINKIFAFAVLLFVVSVPWRVYFAFTETWLNIVNWIAS